jgi:signal transduction histidine kinase
MKTVRARVNITLLAVFLSAAGGTYLGWKSLNTYFTLNADLLNSYEIAQAATLAIDPAAKDEVERRLAVLPKNLQPEARNRGVHELASDYGKRDWSWLRKQTHMVLINEQNLQDYLKPRIEYQRRQFLYVVTLSLAIVFLLISTLSIYVRSRVVGPIRELNRRMEFFLNHRYTYEFKTPAADEIGDLQCTFNTVAQRMIENMQEFQSLDSAKSEFLSIASHELRTPMTSIKGSLALLSGGLFGQLQGQSLKLVQIAEAETDRLIRLINDLLDLAKIEARKLPLQQKWVPLESMMRKTAQGLVGLQQAANVDITMLPVPPVVAYIDPDRIHQVLTNLLSNALKFSPQGGRVRLSCTIDGKSNLTIEVCDEGRGIAPEDRERIFQKFRQATSPESPLVKGTGLGLTIAKALVEEHGGSIGVKSDPGQGSTFYFTLPKWQWLAQIQDEPIKPEVAA